MEDSHSPYPHYQRHSDNATPHVTSALDHVTDGGGSTNGAKYRLMSPAKLPISRSPCITIPPGLSPTSFLESPVLLSNIKVRRRFAFASPMLYFSVFPISARSAFFSCWLVIEWICALEAFSTVAEGFRFGSDAKFVKCHNWNQIEIRPNLLINLRTLFRSKLPGEMRVFSSLS